MESPTFFEQLRQDVLALRTEGPPVAVSYFPEHGVDFQPLDDRVARLDELLTSAVLGVGGAITPGATAQDVWVPLLVAYSQTMLVNYGKTIKLPKIQLDWTVQTIEYHPDGTDFVHPVSPCPLITDLFGLAADYLAHLKTTALAKPALSAQLEEPQPPTYASLELVSWAASRFDF